MKAKLLAAALAFILSAPASAITIFENPAFVFEEHPYQSSEARSFFLFFARPEFSVSHITFSIRPELQLLLPNDNAAFFISGENNLFNLVSAPVEAFRLHTLALDKKFDDTLWLRSIWGNLEGFEGDTDEIGPGWFQSSIGSQFPFPPLAFRFVEAHTIAAPSSGTVPEPGPLALLGIGLLGMWGVRRWNYGC